MSFLAPLFLIGALAVAGPIIFHLIRRTTRERTVFSSLMFLQPSPPRLTQRRRIEHLLLLALRCLALGLLVFGFARPFIKKSFAGAGSSGEPRQTVLLLDVSASMRRSGLWAAAQEKVRARVRESAPSDRVAVYTFARSLTPLVTFEEWQASVPADRTALVSGRLASISPGWSSTELGRALTEAAELLGNLDATQVRGVRQVVVISDLQSGSHLEALQTYEWPKGVQLAVESVKAAGSANAGLQLLPVGEDAASETAAAARVRVSNAADAKREQFKVGWTRGDAAFVGAPVDVYVPPGQSRIVTLPLPADRAATERIVLRGDDDEFDNTVYVAPMEDRKLDVAYVGSDAADDSHQSLFFLQRALPRSAHLKVSALPLRPDRDWPANLIASAPLWVVTDALPDAQVKLLRAQVMAGRTVLFVPKNADGGATLGSLLGSEELALEEAHPETYAMFGEIDFQHPLFAAFADPRFSDFTKIHVWKYRRLKSPLPPVAQVAARFDNGDPALLDVPVGKGRVLALFTGWNADDSQLAVSSKFVPLIHAIVERAAAFTAELPSYAVGDGLPLTDLQAGGTQLVSVRLPSGRIATAPADSAVFTGTTEPGIYRVTSGARSRSFAVNLEPSESRTAPISVDELERFGAPAAKPAQTDSVVEARRETALQAIETEEHQKLWRWFLLATLLVLLAETALAGRTARANLTEGGTPS
jgi:hypothetical protein